VFVDAGVTNSQSRARAGFCFWRRLSRKGPAGGLQRAGRRQRAADRARRPGSQTGSHNLILGTSQTFTSYKRDYRRREQLAHRPVLGRARHQQRRQRLRLSGSGGGSNTASGFDSSVSGGEKHRQRRLLRQRRFTNTAMGNRADRPPPARTTRDDPQATSPQRRRQQERLLTITINEVLGHPGTRFCATATADTRTGQTVDGGLFLRVSQRFGSWVDHKDLDHSVGIEEDLAVVVDHFAA